MVSPLFSVWNLAFLLSGRQVAPDPAHPAAGTAPESPRLGGRSDFTKFYFDVSRTQTLFAPWRGATVALMGLATGQ